MHVQGTAVHFSHTEKYIAYIKTICYIFWPFWCLNVPENAMKLSLLTFVYLQYTNRTISYGSDLGTLGCQTICGTGVNIIFSCPRWCHLSNYLIMMWHTLWLYVETVLESILRLPTGSPVVRYSWPQLSKKPTYSCPFSANFSFLPCLIVGVLLDLTYLSLWL